MTFSLPSHYFQTFLLDHLGDGLGLRLKTLRSNKQTITLFTKGIKIGQTENCAPPCCCIREYLGTLVIPKHKIVKVEMLTTYVCGCWREIQRRIHAARRRPKKRLQERIR